MLPYFTEQFGNPHSTSHPFGRIAAEAIEAASRLAADNGVAGRSGRTI